MKNKFLTVLALSALGNAAALPGSGAWASEGSNFSLAAGIDYSSGKYGLASTTNILSIPFAVMYWSDIWMLRLTIPYVVISGPEGVVPGGRHIMATRSRTADRHDTVRLG